MTTTTLTSNKPATVNTSSVVLGVDEVGRGPLAGPVIAACVQLDDNISNIPGIMDSKKLTANKRSYLAKQIACNYNCYTASASVEEIDKYNILQATKLAIARAIAKCPNQQKFALIDGNMQFEFNHPYQSIIKGDQHNYIIAAASIIAKVYRDNLMIQLSNQFPKYCWDSNKGYGSKKHIEAIQQYGLTSWHRQTFCWRFVN